MIQPDFDMIAFGARIREMRNDAGFSQGDIANEIGLGRTQVSQWETGKHVPHISSIAKFLRLVMRERIPHEANFLILGHQVGSWKPASKVPDPKPTKTELDVTKYVGSLEAQVEALKDHIESLKRERKVYISVLEKNEWI